MSDSYAQALSGGSQGLSRAEVTQLKAEIAQENTELAPFEVQWRDRQEFLERRGYVLRARYHPGWVASWKENPELDPSTCEDYHTPPLRPNHIDARRRDDNALVYIKRLYTDSEEARIARYLYRPEVHAEERNHSVPILDFFQDEESKEASYLVMPFLLPMDYPPFQLVGEVCQFVDQTLEGLVFMHEQGVAHRDCTLENIMMDANSMFPSGFHPVAHDRLPDGRTWALQKPRCKSRVKYYFIDFGISVRKPAGAPARFTTGVDGREKSVPELSPDVPYDPFKVDVYILGKLLQRVFLAKYNNVEFLRPLVEYMTTKRADERPDAAQVLGQPGTRQLQWHFFWTRAASRLLPSG
ncbi:kinase-like domain-containing protein [Phanerochaete sordida]|uniref:Kinase-like domain-containing protein n=1 Tax=Phanerochaete sordida TaxID=48140 RepID=A0A9P3GCV7_9APHY|nr:kinase-like domain-containing protein [Phanerochaete sordida]